MGRQWSPDDVLGVARSYQRACVLTAAADLDVFSALSSGERTASSLASELGADLRATAVLLDVLAAMELLEKRGAKYSVPSDVAEILTETGSRSVLPMVRHQANCLRRWVQLPQVVQTGKPAQRTPSLHGEAADQAAFIGAMHTVSGPAAEKLVAQLGPPRFRHLLDVGGASGTWTIAFLRAMPDATATIFDLPDVIPLARKRITDAGMAERVTLAAGDFYTDPLPVGADFVWLSAIAHQNSREQNRELYAKIHKALADHSTLMIRDVVMDDSRTHPPGGAMFAINMLVATAGGGTYTFNEFHEDLRVTGFTDVKLTVRDEFMNSVVRANKP